MYKQLFYSSNCITDIKKLTFIATCFAGFFLFTSNYYLEPGGYSFLKYADALSVNSSQNIDVNVNLTLRDIGYPLLLWLSGYPYHHSLIVIALIHTLMSISIPALIYLTMKPILPRGSYYIALACVISLAPFYYIKWVHHDQAYIFFTILSFFCLSIFIDTKRASYLYAMTLTIIITSLIRPAGNFLFPFFILLAYLFARGSLKHYIICLFIAAFVFMIYSYHRHHFFPQYGQVQSYNGGQLFQNLYLNSIQYGITLSPDLGPNMKKITEIAYQYMLSNHGIHSPPSNVMDPHDKFYQSYIYPFKANEFAKQIYITPCLEYHELLYTLAKNDPLFMRASFEIIRKYPWYPFTYTSRNMWYLFYEPGYSYPKYSIQSLDGPRKQEAFSFDRESSSELNRLPYPAIQELTFDTLDHKPLVIKEIMHILKHFFCLFYLFFTKILFFLMLVCWTTICIYLFSQLHSSSKLKYIMNILLPIKFRIAITILSLYLFQSMFIISALVDPMMRFHNHLIPFKIMLASIGIAIIFRTVQFSKNQYALIKPPLYVFNQRTSKQHHLSSVCLIILIVALLICWSGYIIYNT